jgi:membrane protein
VLVISALVSVLYGERIIDNISGSYGFGEAFAVTWKLLQWPMALAFMLLAFALIYYIAPDLRDQKWTWVSPGAVVGVGLWLLVSFAFRAYLYFFNSYSKTYGTLGAVIILMLWLYLTGAAILIGGEVNSEIEDAAARAGAADAKEKGEKSPDEKEKREMPADTVPARQPIPVSTIRPAYDARKSERKRLGLGEAIAVFGAFCLALLQRAKKKKTTINH